MDYEKLQEKFGTEGLNLMLDYIASEINDTIQELEKVNPDVQLCNHKLNKALKKVYYINL